MSAKQPNPTSDNDDNDGAGPWNDSIPVPDSAELLRELLSQPPDELTGDIVGLVTAMRIGEGKAAAEMIQELLDPDYHEYLVLLYVRCASILQHICNDEGVSLQQFRRYARSIEWRSRKHG